VIIQVLRYRIKLLFCKDKKFYFFMKNIGIYPSNVGLYRIALRHKSASVRITNGISINNERLEFLGDAIIDSIIADYLFHHYPDKKEGFLTQMRAKMVSRSTLNSLARDIQLHKIIISHTRHNKSKKNIYGNAFEALVGAVYLDKGYKATFNWLIDDIYNKFIDLKRLERTELDFKSRLIEWGQKNKIEILFHIKEDISVSKQSIFFSEIEIENEILGKGKGTSKKAAEQEASKEVLKNLKEANKL